jgi:hypothetical protein
MEHLGPIGIIKLGDQIRILEAVQQATTSLNSTPLGK